MRDEPRRTGCLGWLWWPFKLSFQTFAVLFALSLMVGWIILLKLPSVARSTGADVLMLSLRVLDFETTRPLLPFYLLDPEGRVRDVVTQLRGPSATPTLPGEVATARRVVGTLYDLEDPLIREQIRLWGDGLIRLESYRARKADLKNAEKWHTSSATLDEACLAVAPVLRGIQPNAAVDLARLAELVQAAFPTDAERKAALAWADGLYDRMEGLFQDARAELQLSERDREKATKLREVPLSVVLPPRTPATAYWLLYQYVGLDETSRQAAARQWQALFPEERRDRVVRLGRRIEQERRDADEPLPAPSPSLPWICVLHRYQGYDATGTSDRAHVVERIGLANLSLLGLVLLVANPSDDLFFPMTTSDPLRLLPDQADTGLLVIVLMVLFATYGFRLLLLPIWGEFVLRLHHSRAYRAYRAGRAHGVFAVRLACYIGIPLLGWAASLIYLPEDLVPMAGDSWSMLFAAFVAVFLGGLFVGAITRVTALVLLRAGVDVNRVWWDEVIGLTLSLGLLAYFGNEWVNLLVFASAELVPMALHPRPDPATLDA